MESAAAVLQPLNRPSTYGTLMTSLPTPRCEPYETSARPCVCGEHATKRRYSLVTVLPFAVLWLVLLSAMLVLMVAVWDVGPAARPFSYAWMLLGVLLAPLAARCRACVRCNTLRVGPFGWNIEALDQTGFQYCLDQLDNDDDS